MDHDYWLGRWERGETGWHQTEVEPALIRYFQDLEPTRVLVPLCGKSLDLAWLASRGHEVIGVELSGTACREYFVAQGIPFRESAQGRFQRFEGGGVTIFNGDVFSITPLEVGRLGAVYDRAALIALPPQLRSRYAAKLRELIEPTLAETSCSTRPAGSSTFRFLQLVIERTPHNEKGPPHSVPESEVRALYGNQFKISLQKTELLDVGQPSGTISEEKIFLLEPL